MAVIEQVFQQFWTKFLGDFGASSSAILKPLGDFGGSFSAILEEILRRFCTKYSNDFRATCSDNPSRVVVVTTRKKSEVRVTRSGNVATVCAINSKNGTAIQRAYYERSTDRVGPLFHRLNLNSAP